MIIDAHVHVGNFSSLYPLADSTLEGTVRMLETEGVDLALISSARALLYDVPEGNRESLEVARVHPRLRPYLVVNPWLVRESLNELAHWRSGFVGVKLHPTLHHYNLGSAVADPVLDVCASEGIPVLTHSTGGDPLSGAGAIKTAVDKFPKLKLVIGHGGIFSDRDVAQLAVDYPQLYLEISVEYEAGKLERTVEMIGTERILFGSDCPLHHPSVMLARVKVMRLPREEEENILWRTAQRVFALDVK
jgi:uncharacterized protein